MAKINYLVYYVSTIVERVQKMLLLLLLQKYIFVKFKLIEVVVQREKKLTLRGGIK